MLDFGLFGIFLIAIPVAAVIYYFYYRVGRRKKDFEAVAQWMKFTFVGAGDGSLSEAFSDIRVFKLGRKSAEEFLMFKEEDDLKTSICDMVWLHKHQDKLVRYIETMIFFDSKNLKLPDFCVAAGAAFLPYQQRAALFSKDPFFGYDKVMDYAPSTFFTKKYAVYAIKPELIKPLLTKSKIDQICAVEGDLCIEAHENRLVIYKYRQKVPPQMIESFHSTALRIYTRLLHATSSGQEDSEFQL